jgi:putative aldouronate transport system permease protein
MAFFFFVTMVFNPGIVPWYLVTYNLGLYNNILALIIPRLLFNPFNLFLTRNFMRGIPDSLMESAKIDGARDSYIAFRIYFPLSVPVLATIALFYGLAYWNDWFNAIMLVTNNDLHPLQYFLFRLQSEIQMIRDMSEYMVGTDVELPTETIKMATVIMTIGPIIFLYPFLQRYFVKGLVIGSVKG